MKLIHLSDLHIGKRLNEYSMLEDQAYILRQIIKIIDSESPECVIIAGDVYDKSVPSAESVALFDDFLTRLSERRLQVFVISGNHDSPERIAFGARLMDISGIHMSKVYAGKTEPYILRDSYGDVNVYMLPFIKPAHVKQYTEEPVESYTDAMRIAISEMDPDHSKRNILVTHQFVTGAATSDSEELSVGGSDNVDASVFEGFDYVALGHIHRPQNCSSERVRYCGTPLKYSFSEANDVKSVSVVELAEKGSLSVRTVPLTPLRDMVEIRGSYNEIMNKSYYDNTDYRDAYTHITLTDEEDIPDVMGKLRTVYKNIMKLDYDNTRTRQNRVIESDSDIENKTPFELFPDFYELRNNQPMNELQSKYIAELIGEVWEGEK